MVTSVGSIPFGLATAQTFTNLHALNGIDDGANPYGGLVLSGNCLYGTTLNGGDGGRGTLFAINTNGTGFTILHAFTTLYGSTNTDGANPYGGLILSSNALYGATITGGGGTNFGNGTIFAINTNGLGFRILHTFSVLSGAGTNTDGISPYGRLALSGNTLYGTASGGGWYNGNGTVFAVNTDATGFTNLHNFRQGLPFSSYTNKDGVNPRAGLLVVSNTLYGTTSQGGSSSNGTIFALNTDGTGFKTLYSFPPTFGFQPTTNSDGANPTCILAVSGDKLYGTTPNGGRFGSGTAFLINRDGTGFTKIHDFGTISISGNPSSGVKLSGNALYAATSYGCGGNGYVLEFNTDATVGEETMHCFSGQPRATTNWDGTTPYGELLISGNTLYGTASAGGGWGYGTIFSIAVPPPQLTITRAASNVVLTWPTYAPAVTLQSTTNLVSATPWTSVPTPPSLVNGQNVVTNSASGTQTYYRLSQ
jgi:uncharacterized repeat protein (TIGR03803 family)